MSKRLATELALLYRCEAQYKVPAAPIAQQLVAWEERSLPDVVPPKFKWLKFEWPILGIVDFKAYWREVDRQQD